MSEAGKSQHWSEAETELARALIARRASDAEFRKQLGRSKRCAYARVARVNAQIPGGPAKRALMVKPPSCSPEMRIVVPTSAWDDANHRAFAPRSLTAWLCHDPAPGRSALDRRSDQ
jgi:hypothetical protein